MYLSEKSLSGKIESTAYRISFLGHSMGGLIIRSALEHLSHLRHRFYSYISISTPHLGYLYSPSNMVKMGLWFLKTFD